MNAADGQYVNMAMRLVESIERLLSANLQANPSIDEDNLRFLRDSVKSARPGFPLVIELRPCKEINRLGSVILGPIYTSEAYPWPVDEDANPMAPLCQIATELLPEKVSVGEGLIQVWMRHSKLSGADVEIRVIPTKDVSPTLMTPAIFHDGDLEFLLDDPLEWMKDIHSREKPSHKKYLASAAIAAGYSDVDELFEANGEELHRLSGEYFDRYGHDVVECFQITGFSNANIYCPMKLDEENAVGKLLKLKKKLQGAVEDSDVHLLPLLDDVCEAFDAWKGVCNKPVYPCLLGTFSEIQYSASDKDEPFICFESIGMREWGGGGNAQVFYNKENGFSFDWSCY